MILLINPRSARWNYRIPLSVLAVGAGLEGKFPYEILDFNLERSGEEHLDALMRKGEIRYAGLTVMPGPQLSDAIRISRFLRKNYPHVRIIWGGTFPSIHTQTVMESDLVDFVV